MKSIYDINDGLFINVKDIHDLHCAVSEFLSKQGVVEPNIVKDIDSNKIIVTYTDEPFDKFKYTKALSKIKKFFMEHRMGEARALIMNLIKDFPHQSASYRMLSRIELNQKQIQQAHKYCDIAIKLEPQNTRNIVLRGNLYYYEAQLYEGSRKAELINRAIEFYNWALSIDKENKEAFINKCSLQSHVPEERQKLYNILKEKPNLPLNVYMALGMAYHRDSLKENENGSDKGINDKRRLNSHLMAFDVIHKGVMIYKDDIADSSMFVYAVNLLKEIGRMTYLDLGYRFNFINARYKNIYGNFIKEINGSDTWGTCISFSDSKSLIETMHLNLGKKKIHYGFRRTYHGYWQINLMRDLYKLKFDIEEENFGSREFVIDKKHRDLFIKNYGDDIYGLLKPHKILKRNSEDILEYLYIKYTQKVIYELLNIYIDNLIYKEFPQLRYFLFQEIEKSIADLDYWSKIWDLIEFKFVACPNILKLLRLQQLKDLYCVDFSETKKEQTKDRKDKDTASSSDTKKNRVVPFKTAMDIAGKIYSIIKHYECSPVDIIKDSLDVIPLGDNRTLSSFVGLLPNNKVSLLRTNMEKFYVISLLPCNPSDDDVSSKFHVETSYDKYKYNSLIKWDRIEFDNPKGDLENLVGLDFVKAEIKKCISGVNSYLTMQDIISKNILYFFLFEGNHGTGKSTIGEILSRLYGNLGLLKRSYFSQTNLYRLVNNNKIKTLRNTIKAFEDALEGTLYIDMSVHPRKPLSQDSINLIIKTILDKIQNKKNRILIIIAGCKFELNEIIKDNLLLKSIFKRHLKFPGYSINELVNIFEYFAYDEYYNVTEEAREALRNLFDRIVSETKSNFYNAEFVRQIFLIAQSYCDMRTLGLGHEDDPDEFLYDSKIDANRKYRRDLKKLGLDDDYDPDYVHYDCPDLFVQDNDIKAEDIPTYGEAYGSAAWFPY